MEHRNPYILLGIPYGSSRELALTAFARKSRDLRRQGREGRVAMTDLTWALSQISEVTRNPQAALDIYRIPADPDAFRFSGSGALEPGVEHVPRRYREVPGAEEALRRRAAQEYLRYLVALTGEHTPLIAP